VTLAAGDGYAAGQTVFLAAPNGDVAATSGVTLGGAEIESDGTWKGEWKPIPAPVQGEFKIKLPAASAAVVKLDFK
jgi:hypothetical protein